jgi:hypothetical protein
MTDNLLLGLGDLIGAGPLHRSTLPMLDDTSWQALVTSGAITRSPRADEVLCEACDAGHLGELEWLPETGSYTLLCPEAGYVPVENSDLSRFAIEPCWWIEALARALSIVAPRLEPLIADEAWYLGDAIHGGIELAVLCMTGPVAATRLDALIQHIERLPALPLTVIVTFASTIPRQMLAKQKIWLLRLADVAVLHLRPSTGFQVDHRALVRWLHGFERGQGRPVRRGGSPGKNRALVDEAIAEYRTKHRAIENKTQAAREILKSLRQRHAEIDLPAIGTIRNRLAELEVHETA